MALLLMGCANAVPFPDPATDAPKAEGAAQTAVLAGGCFWGVEAVFDALAGVQDAVSGYAGGSADQANYEIVSTGRTGHAEAVQITYDPSRITYGQILKVYFSIAHDPTQLNRQGPDRGTQYRSAIFYANDEQKRIAEAYIQQLNQAKIYPRAIVTKLESLNGFYRAEAYHQDFIEHNPANPYVVVNDLPKLYQLREQFSAMVKSDSK